MDLHWDAHRKSALYKLILGLVHKARAWSGLGEESPPWLLEEATFEKMGALMAENHSKLLGLYDELSSFLTLIYLYKTVDCPILMIWHCSCSCITATTGQGRLSLSITTQTTCTYSSSTSVRSSEFCLRSQYWPLGGRYINAVWVGAVAASLLSTPESTFMPVSKQPYM